MAHYVKFMRGTPQAFANLAIKDLDTLYFIAEKDSDDALLYLGNKLIAGGEGGSGPFKLDDLTDVLIGLDLAQADFLYYDGNQWVNKSIGDLLFVGATSLSDGQAGFVPAPSAGEEGYFLRGDGTWAPVEGGGVVGHEITIYQDELAENETPAELIDRLTNGKELGSGDMVLFHMGGIRVAYIYTGAEWVPLLEDVYNSFVSIDEKLTTLLSDEESLEWQDREVLRLRNWGKEYYKFVPAVDDAVAHYELQIVDETHPWLEGLEPKVGPDGVLAWYEPNPTTVDGLSEQLAALGTDVTELQNDMSAAEGRLDTTEAAVAALETGVEALESGLAQAQTDISNRYTKDETDTKISEAIANADHLKREIVDSIDDVVEDNVIYMVPTGLTADDDKYDEYMLVNGIVEKVGSWEIDLSQYAKKTDLEDKVDKVEGSRLMTEAEGTKLSGIEEGAEKNIISSTSDSFTINNGQLVLISIPNNLDLSNNTTIDALNATLSNKVSIVEGKNLVSDTEIAKLLTVQEGAEKNIINSVSSEFAISEDRELSLVSIDGTKLNLETNEKFKSALSEIEALNATLQSLSTTVSDNTARITSLEERMTWQDLPE